MWSRPKLYLQMKKHSRLSTNEIEKINLNTHLKMSIPGLYYLDEVISPEKAKVLIEREMERNHKLTE